MDKLVLLHVISKQPPPQIEHLLMNTCFAPVGMDRWRLVRSAAPRRPPLRRPAAAAPPVAASRRLGEGRGTGRAQACRCLQLQPKVSNERVTTFAQ